MTPETHLTTARDFAQGLPIGHPLTNRWTEEDVTFNYYDGETDWVACETGGARLQWFDLRTFMETFTHHGQSRTV